jgi:hypothetical protein
LHDRPESTESDSPCLRRFLRRPHKNRWVTDKRLHVKTCPLTLKSSTRGDRTLASTFPDESEEKGTYRRWRRLPETFCSRRSSPPTMAEPASAIELRKDELLLNASQLQPYSRGAASPARLTTENGYYGSKASIDAPSLMKSSASMSRSYGAINHQYPVADLAFAMIFTSTSQWASRWNSCSLCRAAQ